MNRRSRNSHFHCVGVLYLEEQKKTYSSWVFKLSGALCIVAMHLCLFSPLAMQATSQADEATFIP